MSARDIGPPADRLPRGGSEQWELPLLRDEFFGAPASGVSGYVASTLAAATLAATGSHAAPGVSGSIASTLGAAVAAASGTHPTALRLSGANDALQLATRTNFNNAFMLGWARLSADRNTYSTVFSFENGGQFVELITDVDGTTLCLFDSSTGLVATLGALTVGVNYKVGIWLGSGTFKVWLGVEGVAGVTETTGTCVSLTGLAYQGVGGTVGDAAGEWLNGVLSRVRAGNGAITEAEVEAEFTSDTPLHAGIIGSWFPSTMTEAAPLAAQVGAALIDGAGAGVPSYTFESAPLLDSASGVSGTIAATLSAATAAATGARGASGLAASTLGAATLAATATHPRFGTIASTLGAATVAAAATHPRFGTIVSTLTAATASATGARGSVGAVASTLGAATVAATGARGVTGATASTLEAAAASATATHPRFGAIASTLSDAALAASGSVGAAASVFGTVSATLSAATLSALGSSVAGAVSSTLGAAVSSATGARGVAGQVASTLVSATLSAAGSRGAVGQVAVTLVGASLSATGSHVTGAAASTLAGATLSATGARGAAGVAASSLAAVSASASGTVRVTGLATAALSPAVVTASGARGATGLASSSLAAATLSAEGISFGVVTGAAASTLAPLSVVAFGILGELPFVISSGRTGYVVQLLGGQQRVQDDTASMLAELGDEHTTAVLDEVTNECQLEEG